VILADIKESDKKAVEEILQRYQLIAHNENTSAIRKNSMACVAFNTCPLALAEGQRYLPILVTKIEGLLTKYALEKEEIIIRMTGCRMDAPDHTSLKLDLWERHMDDTTCS
jgi:sulfite reductase (NADPH) hemoprotein beta-component